MAAEGQGQTWNFLMLFLPTLCSQSADYQAWVWLMKLNLIYFQMNV